MFFGLMCFICLGIHGCLVDVQTTTCIVIYGSLLRHRYCRFLFRQVWMDFLFWDGSGKFGKFWPAKSQGQWPKIGRK